MSLFYRLKMEKSNCVSDAKSREWPSYDLQRAVSMLNRGESGELEGRGESEEDSD